MVLPQLSKHLSANSLYSRFQSAYRPGYSTETALLNIINDLLLALDDGNVPLLALLNLSAPSKTTAYYSTDATMILERKARFQNGFYPALQTALSLSVSIATFLSQLPSHSVFHKDRSLDLYSLFFTQLFCPLLSKSTLSFITHTSMILNSRLKSASCYQIPDLLFSMQKCIDDAKIWMTVNKFKLNDDKTEAMTVSSGRKSRSLFSSFPNSRTISVVHLFHV